MERTRPGPFDEEKANAVNWQAWFRNLWQREPSPTRKRAHGSEFASTEDRDPRPTGTHYSGGLRIRHGVVSVTGNVREHNEDSFYVPPQVNLKPQPPLVGAGIPTRSDDSFSSALTLDEPMFGPPGLFIVADGMGGQLAGEKASQMAVELIPHEVGKRIDPDADEKAVQRVIRESVATANQEILTQSLLNTEFANMGTTVVIAHFQGGRAYVTGIGDSRAYRLRGDKIEQLTRDHSLANALGEAGTIRPDEVENHKFKHVLYLYLGSKDARDGPEDVRVVDIKPGDQFLLATDGLMGVVRDEEIRDILRANDDPQRAAQVLVDRALDLRSKDNVTAVVIHLD